MTVSYLNLSRAWFEFGKSKKAKMGKSRSNPRPQRIPKLRGIRMRKWGKWVSEMRIPKSRTKIWLGTYENEEQAARAYDFALYCLKGPNATFNFIKSPFEISPVSSLSQQEIQAAAANFALRKSPHVPRVKMAEGGEILCRVSEVESPFSEEIQTENEMGFWESVLNGASSESDDLEMANLPFPSPVQQHGGIILDQVEWWDFSRTAFTL
ncbi:hypothetical protein SUGI_0127030 [Cryptomeria japonica]|nr:hypothetical protein SUGI_0127030 [Cryptomeria japonica]